MGAPPAARRLPGRFLFPLLLAAGLALWGGRPVAPLAQERYLSLTGEARAPIYQDNLDEARRRALQQAQEAIIQDVLRQLLAPEWYALYEPDLARRVLGRLDRYISAYRVRRLETSIDRTQYFASLEAQVDRALLVNDLRDMALPIAGDRRTPLLLLFRADDPVLSVPEARAAVLEALGARLALLNVEVQRSAAVPATGEAAPAALLDQPFTNQTARQAWLGGAASTVPAVAYLRFLPGKPGERAPMTLQVRFYLVRDGALLADFEQAGKSALTGAPASAAARQAILSEMMLPMANQIQPGSLGNPATWGTQVTRLELRVHGLTTMYEEEAFERDFFASGSPFEKFVLSRLGPRRLTYEGEFRGDRARLERDLGTHPIGAFRVRELYWNDGVLELVVAHHPRSALNELKPFPAEPRPPSVTLLFEELAKAKPELLLPQQPTFAESEDNGRFDSANALLFNSPVYGFLDSRADNDLFVGEALRPGETIAIEWYRLGRTNLTPALRLFDENGVLARTVYPAGEARFSFSVPAGQTRFFLEVADRFGYLIADAGGYLNCHYLLWLRREAPDTPPPPLLPAPPPPQGAAPAPRPTGR
jgi:hypothetical protein